MSFSLPIIITYIEKNEKDQNKDCNFQNDIKNNNYWKTMRAVGKTTLTLSILLRDILVANILLTILSKNLEI